MLVDFCHWSLQPTVTCDKPSCDSYEAQNLVSKDLSLRRKGFLAANFIKPPVNITFQFPCKISIHHILINPVVGAQKSTSVEIYSSCKRITSSWLLSEETLSSRTRERLTFDSPLFVNIGKVSVDQPLSICFTYPRFTANAPYSVERMQLDRCVMSELRNSRYQYLTAVSHVSVRIVRTSGSSVPALKSIEIWGQPAVSNGKDILEKVYTIFSDSITPLPVIQEVKTPTKPETDDTKTDTGLEIPEEFIDPITCDIMALPMLLPCGKSLDQSTLEKYISTESSWGRLPSDPFTGVTFSAESRPIPNDCLKTRIDAFLLHNAGKERLKSVPRTVGRSKHSSNKASNMNPQASVSNLTFRNSAEKREYDTDNQDSFIRNKLIKTNDISFSELNPAESMSSNDQSHQPSTSQSKGGNSSHNKPCLSHEHQLDNSLNQAMSLLSSFPSFTKKPKTDVATQGTQNNSCVNCSSRLNPSTATYRLQCSHLVCRPCVVNSGTHDQSIQCGQCSRFSLLSDITRVHVV